jgi:uncharacterized integral membrane protein
MKETLEWRVNIREDRHMMAEWLIIIIIIILIIIIIIIITNNKNSV